MLVSANMKAIPSFAALLCLSVATLSGCASTHEEVEHFGYAATAPVRDVNLRQYAIPQQLMDLQNPYGTTDRSGCAVWAQEVNQLSTALAINRDRRVGFRRDGNNFAARTGNLRDVGVQAAATYFIPLRGVVRELSGAAQFERDALAASDRGRHRIGYLIGLGRAHRCPGFENPALDQLDPPALRLR